MVVRAFTASHRPPVRDGWDGEGVNEPGSKQQPKNTVLLVGSSDWELSYPPCHVTARRRLLRLAAAACSSCSRRTPTRRSSAWAREGETVGYRCDKRTRAIFFAVSGASAVYCLCFSCRRFWENCPLFGTAAEAQASFDECDSRSDRYF